MGDEGREVAIARDEQRLDIVRERHQHFERQIDWTLDYPRFRIHLREQYGIAKAFLFIGLLPENQPLYTRPSTLPFLRPSCSSCLNILLAKEAATAVLAPQAFENDAYLLLG